MVALDGVDLVAPAGRLTVVVGPSGSGKSTLLRCVAGLEPCDDGRVLLGDRDLTSVPAGARDVALAFQDLALYPHLDVADNVGFGLRARGTPPAERARRVAAVAEALSLTPLLRRRPGELAGGEAQRVALARAVVREPLLLLLDEPFGALDAELRAAARAEVRSVQGRLAVTTVLVTHDPAEALALAHHLVVLRAGHVVQAGPPLELHDRPATPLVARLLGLPPMSVVPASLALGTPGDHRPCGLRPDAVSLTGVGAGVVDGTVAAVELTGNDLLVRVDAGSHEIAVRVPRGGSIEVPLAGSGTGLAWDPADVWVFPGGDGDGGGGQSTVDVDAAGPRGGGDADVGAMDGRDEVGFHG